MATSKTRSDGKQLNDEIINMGIKYCNDVNILGVTLTSDLRIDKHISNIVVKCSRTLYALKMIRNSGLDKTSLHDVFNSTIISNILYAVNAWIGLSNKENLGRIEKIIKRGTKMGLWPKEEHSLRQLIDNRAKTLFTKVLTTEYHVLHHLLPEIRNCKYSLRRSLHNRCLPEMKSPHDIRNFIIRKIYE